MSVQVCVLGSGSRGNATLVMTPALHLLIDAGFTPDEMGRRLDGTGASWETLDALLLTHTHGDHLKKRCLSFCATHGIQFICHAAHARQLQNSRYFKRLEQKGLVRTHDGLAPLAVGAQSEATLQPIALSHDAPPTFGFRIETAGIVVAYLADLGECALETARFIADADILALEFNHDEAMELASGRHPALIERVLSDIGHLSNAQAAEVFRQVLAHCSNGGPKVLLQLHLSAECNRPELAFRAAQEVSRAAGARTQIFSTRQESRGTVHNV